MPMLKGYPDGSDITIIDAIYTKPKKIDFDGSNWTKPTMDIIFRDNLTNLKHVQRIEDPKIEFYMANDDVYIEEGVFPPYLPLDKVHPVICKYNNLKMTIAKLTGQYEDYMNNIRSGLAKNNDKIHRNNKLYRSDMQIEDYYRYEFDKRYTNNVDLPLKKMYLDIEVDGINMLGDFPTPSDSPINAVTLIDDLSNNVYTFLLRDPNNKQCKDFEESLKDPQTFTYIKDFITEHLGGYKKATRLGCNSLEFNFYFFDEEIEMIYDIYRLINTIQPDFVLAWNMAFDIPFTIDRIKYLGYDPRDIMRHPDFSFNDELYYFVDPKHTNEPAEAGDFARIPSYSIYLDQMKQFASRRKGQHAFPSNKLDDIAYAVAGIHKYDYHSITPDLVKLPRVNYFIFVMYNILDVICQKAIEKKTGDIDFVFNKCITTNTRYSKVHRQTIYLYNKAAKSYELNGFMICNNINKWNAKPTKKFKGAFVADYRLNDDSLKVHLNGFPISVYNNADDFDYARLYPSTIQENNMATENQYGKIFIPKALHDRDNRFGDPRYDRGGAFIEDFQPHMWLEFCERWLHLAGYADLIDDIREYFDTQATISFPMDFRWENGKPLINPLIKCNGLTQPISKVENLEKCLIKYKEPNFDKIKDYYLAQKLKELM